MYRRKRQPLPPTDDPVEVIRRAVGMALEFVNPGRGVGAFTAVRYLHAAGPALERVAAERAELRAVVEGIIEGDADAWERATAALERMKTDE